MTISPSKNKHTRKVKLTSSEVGFAELINKPLEEVAKDKLAKRGRPLGSKNKPKSKPKSILLPYSIAQDSSRMRRINNLLSKMNSDHVIDYRLNAEKAQARVDELEVIVANLNHKIEQYKTVVDYFETKLGLPK